jgi:8-oxo-dGTP pyrophosphatase MutT (NUDIX family)
MESIAFSGKIGEVVHTKQPDGRTFEKYRRAPGVRLVIISPDNKLLVAKEFRQETGNVDLRLPGGKVCDTLKELHSLLKSNLDMTEAASAAALKEASEETGLIIHEPRLITIARAGATVEWDLYYFEVRNYSESKAGQRLEVGEDIETEWMELEDVKKAVIDGRMQEWRSVGVLLGRIFPLLASS